MHLATSADPDASVGGAIASPCSPLFGMGPGRAGLRPRTLLGYVCEPLVGAALKYRPPDSPWGEVRIARVWPLAPLHQRQLSTTVTSRPPSATARQHGHLNPDRHLDMPHCGSGSAPNLAGVTGSRPRHSRSVTASSGRVGLHSTPPSRRLYDRLHHVSRFSHPPDWGVVETPPRAPVSCEQDKCAA